MAVNVNLNSGKQDAQQAMQEYETALATLSSNWSGLTAAQKSDALRAALLLTMRAVRYLIRRSR